MCTYDQWVAISILVKVLYQQSQIPTSTRMPADDDALPPVNVTSAVFSVAPGLLPRTSNLTVCFVRSLAQLQVSV